MDLSVIIPTFNRVNLIKYTLDSLDKKFHDDLDIEVIVVDDGSKDGTWGIVAENYPEVKLIRNKSKGAAAARNTGLEIATGKYINYLDSDDLAGPDFYTKKIAYLNQHPETVACYGFYEYFQSDGAFTPDAIMFKHKYPMITAPDKSRAHLINYLSGNFLPQNSIVWRRDFLQRISGHDIHLAVNQDVELFVRAVFNGLSIVAVPDETKVFVRDHVLDNRVGDPRNSGKKWEQILALREKIYNDLPTNGYGDKDSYSALSSYLFGYWKQLRHQQPETARKYLTFAKKIYWPVEIRGSIGYRMLSKVLGPVKAVNLKYFLLKRD